MFRFDNMTAGMTAAGRWSDQSCAIVRRTRQIMQYCEHLWGACGFRWMHTPAHRDHPWNELADVIAGTIMAGRGSLDNLPDFEGGVRLGDVDFTFAGYVNSGRTTGYPRFCEGTINWAPHRGSATAIAPDKLIPTTPGRAVETIVWKVKAVTVNIQSGLDKLKFLEQQFLEQQFHIVFMQEMKGKGGLIRSKSFLRYESPSEGVWGCAVWVARTQPFARCDGKDYRIDESDITVQIARPRMLVVKIRTPASFFYAGSLHRPAQTRPFEERQAFETDLSAFLEECSGSPCLIGMDANGRVPGHADGITGDLLCGDPDHSGVQLVQTIGTFGCWLPSTFSECHHGPTETWTHPGGKRSRIDFSVVSRHFCPHNVCTWAATEIDTLNCNDDHDAVGFHVTLWQACRGDKPPQLDRKRQYDPRKLRDPAVVQRIERWIDCFGLRYVPWEIDVNLHAQIIQDVLLAILCREAPVDERGPVSSYVPMDAWRVREARQIFKRRTRYRKQHGFADTIRLYFGRWASTAEPAGGVWPVTKDVLLYEVMAAAVKISTLFIKKRIRECKIELLENIASQVGVTSPANIFRRLKEMRLGARQPKLWKSSLPNLRNMDGELVSGRLQLDRAWLEYFGEMEMGTIVNTADFVTQVASPQFMEVDFAPDASLLPSLSDVERILRSTKTDKAAGLDKMPGEILRWCPGSMSAILHPIFTKAILRGRQPIQWRGGLLIEALKRSGAEMTLSGHRSLFVGSVLGKAFHRFVRSRVIGVTEDVLRDTHFGARRGATVTQASHVAVLFEAVQAARRRSSAVLFMDAKSAYYCVIRQMVYGCAAGTEDDVMVRIMRHFNLPADSWQRLLTLIEDGGLWKQYGMSDHVRHVAKDLHDASFFVTRHSTGEVVVQTQLGSRPGESMADVIFAWIFHRVLDEIAAALRKDECDEVIPAGDETSLWGTSDEGSTPVMGPVWADDGAFLASHADPAMMLDRARALGSTVVRTFLECGLTPNLEKGKSEMMLTFRGTGSRKVQTAVFADGCRTLEVDAGPWGRKQLRLVASYVHLGCALDRGATLKLEAHRRNAKAIGAFQEHRRRIYQNRDIPLPVRGVLFTAMVESTLFNLEIWGAHSGPAWEKLRAGHGRLLRKMLVRDLPAEKLLASRLSDLVAVTEHPPLEIVATCKRLRYAITLARGAPGALWALLHYEGFWQRVCRSDFDWLLRYDVHTWPPFNEGTWAIWWRILREQEGAFRRAVKRAARAAAAGFALQGTADRLRDGLLRRAYRHQPTAFRLRGEEAWLCGPCRRVFRRKAHLACHMFKVHRRHAEVRYYLTGAVCVGCGKDFVTEDRLQRHLGYSAACWMIVKGRGTTTQQVAPGIGSNVWKQQKTDFPIMHPPVPAELYVSGSNRAEGLGETPGEALIRQCTWAVGEWLSAISEELSFEGFVAGCAKLMTQYPLYPAEMRDVLLTTRIDVDLCVEEELLMWSLQRTVQVKGWLVYCIESVSGGWLCEWLDIPTDCDVGPYKILAHGAQEILDARAQGLRPSDRLLLIGEPSPEVERTLRLDGFRTCSKAKWTDQWSEVACPQCSTAVASLQMPGEAVAGSVKSTAALDRREADGVFACARCLIDFEPKLKELWNAFLQGMRVHLFVSGSRGCGSLFRSLEIFQQFGWSVTAVGETAAIVSSDARDLRPLLRVSPCN